MVKDVFLEIFTDCAGIDKAEVKINESIINNGLDSLNLVVLREAIERSFGCYIPDSKWMLFVSPASSIQSLIDHICSLDNVESQKVAPNRPHETSSKARTGACDTLLSNGHMKSSMEIGMPLTGRNNLAEGPLLQQLGDLRWKHMCKLAGIISKNVTDDQGSRLYPTFYHVDIVFPKNKPMASFGENDRFDIIGELKRFGTSMLDGRFFLCPEGTNLGNNITDLDQEEILKKGVPIVTLSNIFVMQFNGSEWLKKARPANPGFENITEIYEPPESYSQMKAAEHETPPYDVPDEYLPITDKVESFEYKLLPDRDLNGAGLVYFAHYPVFLDICERRLLESSAFNFQNDLINKRTLVRRRSAYFNNASAEDSLNIEISAFLRNPFKTSSIHPELEPVDLMFYYRMYRKSDNRLMMSSFSEKTIYDRTCEDLTFFDSLKEV